MDKVLKRNFSYLFLLQSGNYIIPLILLPYLTHVLGPENFGKISFVQAFTAYFVLLTEYGFNTSATQEIVKVRENKQELTKVFWTTTVTKIFFALSGFLLLVILVLTIPKLSALNLLILIASTGLLASILFPVWLFQGLEKMSYITLLNIIPRMLVLVATLIFVKQQSDFTLALIIQSAGLLFSAIACSCVIYCQKIVGLYFPDLKEIRSTVVEGWHIFFSGVATNFYTTTNIVVLGFLTNDRIVGIFSASEKVIRAFISLLSSISQVTFPRINSYYKESKTKAVAFGIKLLNYSAVITLGLGIILLISAPLLVRMLFGLPQYSGTINVIRISSFLPFFAICKGILAVNFLVTFQLKRYLAKIVSMGCIFSLALVIPAAVFFNANGIAMVALLTEILISLLLMKILRKFENLKIWKLGNVLI